MNPDPIHIVLVSPIAALRAGWRAFLSADSAMEITAESTSLNLLDPDCPPADVLVISSDSSDAAQLRAYTRAAPSTAVLLLVNDEALALRSFSGLFDHLVFGVLPASLAPEAMIAAVHALFQGLSSGTPRLLAELLAAPRSAPSSAPKEDIDALTQRETEILQLLARGMTNKQIAFNLSISEHTVKFHIQSIYAKMRVNNRAEVVRVGLTSGLINV